MGGGEARTTRKVHHMSISGIYGGIDISKAGSSPTQQHIPSPITRMLAGLR